MPKVVIGTTPQLESFLKSQAIEKLTLVLDGKRMRNVEQALGEFAAELRFPEYFGGNFNALFDCLTDLDWLRADSYLLVVKHAECLLDQASGSDLTALINLLEETCDYWQNDDKPGQARNRKGQRFEVLYHATADQEELLARRLGEYDMPRVEILPNRQGS